jgi:hypothetical protein
VWVHARIEKFAKREAAESRVIMAVLCMALGARGYLVCTCIPIYLYTYIHSFIHNKTGILVFTYCKHWNKDACNQKACSAHCSSRVSLHPSNMTDAQYVRFPTSSHYSNKCSSSSIFHQSTVISQQNPQVHRMCMHAWQGENDCCFGVQTPGGLSLSLSLFFLPPPLQNSFTYIAYHCWNQFLKV